MSDSRSPVAPPPPPLGPTGAPARTIAGPPRPPAPSRAATLDAPSLGPRLDRTLAAPAAALSAPTPAPPKGPHEAAVAPAPPGRGPAPTSAPPLAAPAPITNPKDTPALAATFYTPSPVPVADVRQTVARIGLRGTIAAPLPQVASAYAGQRATMSTSVLPRIELDGPAVKLLPNEGAERYANLKTLGAGGMGEVALVEDRDIGRTVAVKRLLGDQHPAVLARFIDEIRTVGALEHPNIVPIHDVGVDEQGRYFFVMKYVDGEDLETIIERLRAGDPQTHAKYPIRRRLDIFLALMRALHYAHTRNIIHRDLKPANVMVGRYGEVVLMDWGIARPIGAGALESRAAADPAAPKPEARASDTQSGALVGTPMYMSPEQAQGRNDELDARSDLFSAFVLLHEFLSLRHRFEGIESLDELLEKVRTTQAPPPYKVFTPHPAQRENIPYELTHFVRRGLQTDPAQRWQSAQEVIDELLAIFEGKCRVQCPTTMLKRTTSNLVSFIDRAPGLAMLVMYGGALTGVVLAVRALLRALL